MFEGSNKYFQFVSGFAAFGFTFLQAIDWFFEKYEIAPAFAGLGRNIQILGTQFGPKIDSKWV